MHDCIIIQFSILFFSNVVQEKKNHFFLEKTKDIGLNKIELF